MFKHLPNILTIIRFLLIPVIVLFALNNNYIAAIVVLTISGITDILDGYIARRFNLISDFGKLMDPFADKATQLTILVVLSINYSFLDYDCSFVKRGSYDCRCIFPLWKRARCI